MQFNSVSCLRSLVSRQGCQERFWTARHGMLQHCRRSNTLRLWVCRCHFRRLCRTTGCAQPASCLLLCSPPWSNCRNEQGEPGVAVLLSLGSQAGVVDHAPLLSRAAPPHGLRGGSSPAFAQDSWSWRLVLLVRGKDMPGAAHRQRRPIGRACRCKAAHWPPGTELPRWSARAWAFASLGLQDAQSRCQMWRSSPLAPLLLLSVCVCEAWSESPRREREI
jgi:hypothetical protein